MHVQRHHHLSLGEILHTHPLPRPPGSHRDRDPMPMSPRDGSDGSPESLPEMYPHAWIQAVCAHVVVIPCMMFLQSLCVHTQPRQRTYTPSSPQREDQPSPWIAGSQLLLGFPPHAQHHCISALMVAFSHLERGTVFRLLKTGQSPRQCWLKPTQDEQGSWSHSSS